MNAPVRPTTAAALRAVLRRQLTAALGPAGAREVEALLGHALSLTPAALIAHPERVVTRAGVRVAQRLAARRARGEPLAYLTGRRGFWTLELDVTPAVLVPRPETETLVEAGLGCLAGRPAPRVADLGTGSGAVACAFARERPDAWVLATDADGAALAVAGANARRLGLGNVRFARADWLTPLREAAFDLIVANPPYIAAGDPCLDADGVRCEPRHALVSGADGLDALRAIAAAAPRCLAPGGWLALEHGAAQGAAVRVLLAAAGLTAVTTVQDLAGRPRVTTGQRP